MKFPKQLLFSLFIKFYKTFLNGYFLVYSLNFLKQVSLRGRLTTLEQKRSFRTQFWLKIFFLEVSALLSVRHSPKLQSCRISGKTNDGTLRKWHKPYPNFERNLGPTGFFSRVLSRQYSKLSSYAIPRKTNELNLKKYQKT